MIKFYFAINKAIIEKYGMPKATQHGIGWHLKSDSLCGFAITETPGKLIDLLGNVELPIAICEAYLSDKDSLDALGCVLTGDTIKCFDLVITKITWYSDTEKPQ